MTHRIRNWTFNAMKVSDNRYLVEIEHAFFSGTLSIQIVCDSDPTERDFLLVIANFL